MSEKALTTTKPQLPMGPRGVSIDSMDSLFRFSDAVHQSGLAPTTLRSPQAIMIAIEMGLEVGLPPMAALQNIAVVNGRPTIWGDAQLGIVRSTGELEQFSEWYEVNGQKTTRNPTDFGDDVTAVCKVKRFGFDEQECAFSVADAKRAGLWGKAGPWTQYPARMLRYRSRSFALRDAFGDALRGLLTTEEVVDIEAIPNVTPKADPSAAPTFKEKRAKKTEPAPTPEPVAAEPTTVQPDPTPKVEQAPVDPEPAQSQDDPILLAHEQQLLAEFVAQTAKADFDTFRRGMLKQSNIAFDESWDGFHDIPIASCMRAMGAKKWLLGIIESGRE